MELMMLRSGPAAIGLPRPNLRRLLSTPSFTDSLSFPTKSAAAYFHCPAMPSSSSSMKASATGSVASASGISKQEGALKEKDVVFVAGSTGKVGSRLVRELLKLGFRVRAGVRSSQRAGALVQCVVCSSPAEERLEIVECDLENQNTIRPAIANASIVMCCIGASEKEVFDITGPYRIDYKATSNLIQEAKNLKVDHFILLTSLGTGKTGFPAALLNLFWGVLCWKRKAEEELISIGLPYTIVRPGGMERPTDSFKETHNLVLAKEDTYFGGLVSNLQVAELMACMAKNRKLSYCKVVEVIAETTAPLLPMEQLLSTIPNQRPLPPEPQPQPQPQPEAQPQPVQVSKRVPQSPYTSYEDLKPPSSPMPSQPMAETKSTDSSSLDTKEPTQLSVPQSPYTSYEDLKPPSSPMPSQPMAETKSTDSSSLDTKEPTQLSVPEPEPEAGHKLEPEPDSVQVSKPSPQSPYTAYEDLKPPSSPTPPQPKSTALSSVPTQVSDGSTVPLSPFPTYEDLKPPSSPSPSVPNNGTPTSISASKSENSGLSPAEIEPDQIPEKSYPLSPYTMYEDLKPPTSPVPSVPK
ncbi:Protein TIC 62 [Carex littledalei]|uniref:Protein TIC 62 n=1 Tax=Carex littledalei TaxID=544730 RepID=A0A833RFV0_9POAL|nr:Protein TIC 62 [Carex littledalei]